MPDAPHKTPLYEKHVAHCGRIVEFAGFLMPVQYESIVAEHNRVRSTVGVFDVSHMGRVEVRGRDALEFLNRITTNDVSQLQVGQAQYSAFCYPHGGIVDDLLVYCLSDHYLLVINASNARKDLDWLRENLKEDASLTEVTAQMVELAIQGPKAESVVQQLTSTLLAEIGYYRFALGKLRRGLSGPEDVEAIISRTGYTGEDGFELYFDSSAAPDVWDAVLQAGRGVDIGPIGLGARDSLRLEMGLCLYGNDITQDTTPLEAGLGWITKLNKGEFIGREALVRQKQEGVRRKLVGFELLGRAFPRHEYPIFAGDARIGEVTSGLFSPSLSRGIGMGYVDLAHSATGAEIEIDVRGRREKARVVPRPFYKQATHK